MGRTFDDILELGGDYSIERFDVGKTPADESHARLRVTRQDDGRPGPADHARCRPTA